MLPDTLPPRLMLPDTLPPRLVLFSIPVTTVFVTADECFAAVQLHFSYAPA